MTILPAFTRSIAAALISSCFLPLASWAADDSVQLRTIVDTAIRPLMAEYDLPGMAVAVTVNGQSTVFNYGLASREDKTPVGEATLFELGSVSKTFTATLATYAQELGKLSLDDHPGKYMPQLKGSALDKASLLNLGTYTAGGLPLQVPDEVANFDQMVAYFRQWKPDSAPSAQRNYSNPSIGLLGYITGLALHSDFATALETRLLPQLGLTHSYVRVPDSAMVNYAWGYDKDNKPGRVKPDVFATEAYGLKATAADMIRFVQANIEPGRQEAALRRALEGTHVGYFKVRNMVQGLGWEQYPYPITLEQLVAGNSPSLIFDANAAKRLTPPQAPAGATLFNKTGSTSRFGAYVAFVPEQKIGIVMLANKNYPIPARIKAAHAILAQLSPAVK
ncbi:beta-lactamase [Oxalobacteraceae bacterium]|nr:beta-lactamase [Oxalobacteraceae bacterium]